MSEHMRTHHTKHVERNANLSMLISTTGDVYKIPEKLYINLKKYEVKGVEQKNKAYNLFKQLRWKNAIKPDNVFSNLNTKYSKLGAIVRGIRQKESLSQKVFAMRINITQTDLSKIESGKRAIGKNIISRITKEFKVNNKIFL